MLDQVSDVRRVRWFLSGLGLFVVSGCMSYGELRYRLSGRDAEAVVSKSFETGGVRGNARGAHTVEYDFVEPDGTVRGGSDDVPSERAPAVGERVKVHYMPGKDGRSRLASNSRMIYVAGFGLACVALAVGMIMLVREGARDGVGRSRFLAGRGGRRVRR